MGLDITNLHEYEQAPPPAETEDKIGAADMIWVTGGDTLRMIDFWKKHGIATELDKAAANGTVLSGGSAGMLAWLERGHSDSLSYRAGLALHDKTFRVVGKSDDVRQAEVHILRKENGGLTSEQLPMQQEYAPFDL